MSKRSSEPAGPTPAAVVSFWRDAGPQRWFTKDLNFDRALGARFHAAHLLAAERKLDAWNLSAEGALALQILLDQVPRNLFRGSAHSWATDPLARRFAVAAIEAGLDASIEPGLRPFCYMALMHAEDLALQERCVALFEALGGPSLPHAIEHRDIIRRFGRFPHRNAALGRDSTEVEVAFLKAGGFAG
ncbi:DUF924 family protein [Aquimonas sp.]|jgi:uncharacterized protein (DUF924 family)|uniref:DUF924 family protein n=1 Tax=Aquimonas sp. TaxID=1872588 RepID=UPI0037BF0D96